MGFDVLYRNVTANRLNHGRLLQAFWRVAVWQIRSRLAGGGKVKVRFVNHTSLAVSRGMTGATGNIYSGLDEPDEMGFLLHVLRAEDFFVNVGANVGVYTVLAAGVIGARAVAFEPAPATFVHLQDNLALNRIELKADARNVAIGATHGTLRFSTVRGPQNHVLRADESVATAIEVPVLPLDDALAGRVPTLMKIDVEGYEGAVLEGGRRTLESPTLFAVIMEIGKHTARYGHDEMTLRREMKAFGFTMCRYDAIARTLEPFTGDAGENTIFVRDLAAVRARIAGAAVYTLCNGTIEPPAAIPDGAHGPDADAGARIVWDDASMATAHSVSSANPLQQSSRDWLCHMARLGYASRGVVYIAVGVLAILAALGSGNGATTGPRGALSYVSGGPFGAVVLAVLGVGLFSFAAWRFLQAALNLDHADNDAKGWIKRGSMVVSGIVHATLGIWVATALLSAGSGSSDDEGSHRWTAWLLEKPGGHWLVGAVGAIIIAAGVVQIIKGYKAKFEKRLSLDYDRLPWMRGVCRFGLIARGIVFGMIGGLFIRAALHRAPNESGGVATVLRELQRQPWGWVLLGIAALGLIAFGIYGLVEARYRKIQLPG